MNLSLVTLSVTCIVTVTWGHLCLISPPQRGSLVNINTPGSEDCLAYKELCGETNEEIDAQITLKPGQRFVLTFQKNRDHTYEHRPGYFILRIFPADKPEDGVQILEFDDSNEDDLHLYTENITIPDRLSGHVVFQVQYYTLNPNRGPVYYSCADVEIRSEDD